jgi:hypothetical protein
MRRALVLAVTLGALLVAPAGPPPAEAHVAPSVDDNNRYLKLTPLGDRVRLAYVVFYGEVPGAQTRPSLDADGDGAIGDAEAQAFGDKLAGEIAAALDISIDGAPQRIAWTTISVGLGSSRVAAGAFSVDLVAFLCLPAARGRHEVRLSDRFRLPRPGETELRVEDGPGITIERAQVGDLSDPSWTYRFAGPGGPLTDPGLELAFTAGEEAIVAPDKACAVAAGGAASGGGLAKRPVVLIAVAAAAVLAAAAAAAAGTVLVRRRRHRARTAAPSAQDLRT